MSEDDARAALAHDVGKYVARTARNLRDGHCPPALLPLLLRDLYDADDGKASARFGKLVFAIGPEAHAEFDGVVRAFAEIDRLEPEVRAGGLDAVSKVARLALEISARLLEAR